MMTLIRVQDSSKLSEETRTEINLIIEEVDVNQIVVQLKELLQIQLAIKKEYQI